MNYDFKSSGVDVLHGLMVKTIIDAPEPRTNVVARCPRIVPTELNHNQTCKHDTELPASIEDSTNKIESHMEPVSSGKASFIDNLSCTPIAAPSLSDINDITRETIDCNERTDINCNSVGYGPVTTLGDDFDSSSASTIDSQTKTADEHSSAAVLDGLISSLTRAEDNSYDLSDTNSSSLYVIGTIKESDHILTQEYGINETFDFAGGTGKILYDTRDIGDRTVCAASGQSKLSLLVSSSHANIANTTDINNGAPYLSSTTVITSDTTAASKVDKFDITSDYCNNFNVNDSGVRKNQYQTGTSDGYLNFYLQQSASSQRLFILDKDKVKEELGTKLKRTPQEQLIFKQSKHGFY